MDVGVKEPRDRDDFVLESGFDQDGVMGAQREMDVNDFVFGNLNVSQGVDEFSVNLFGRAVFKAPEFGGQEAVKSIGRDREDDAEVDLDFQGRAEGVQVEKVNAVCDGVFDDHAFGVAGEERRGCSFVVVGDQQGGKFPAQIFGGDLTQFSFIALKGNCLIDDFWGFIFAMRNIQFATRPGLGRQGHQLLNDLFGFAAEREESNAAPVEFGEIMMGGESGVKDEFGRIATSHLFPVICKREDGIGLIPFQYPGVTVTEHGAGAVLGQEGHDASLGVAATRNVVFFQDGVLAEVSDGVEIEVEGFSFDQTGF